MRPCASAWRPSGTTRRDAARRLTGPYEEATCLVKELCSHFSLPWHRCRLLPMIPRLTLFCGCLLTRASQLWDSRTKSGPGPRLSIYRKSLHPLRSDYLSAPAQKEPLGQFQAHWEALRCLFGELQRHALCGRGPLTLTMLLQVSRN
jgi:hypothetical protein